MKLFYSPTSPYVRKVIVTAMEKGLDGRIERMKFSVSPVARDAMLTVKNPLGKIPCLLTDDGDALFDSAVITAYLDQLSAPALTPSNTRAKFRALTLESMADGFLDAGILTRYEHHLRPADKRWDDWYRGQMAKMIGAIDALEKDWMGDLEGPMTIGSIAVGCALGWFDFRHGTANWREGRPRLTKWADTFLARPSMQATKPVG